MLLGLTAESFGQNPIFANHFSDNGLCRLSYIKHGEGTWPKLATQSPTILVSFCSTILTLKSDPGVSPLQLDARNIHLLPAASSVTIEAISTVSEWLTLELSNDLFAAVEKEHGLDQSDLKTTLFNKGLTLHRSNWMNEVIHRYAYERIQMGKKSNVATQFLETELIKELLYAKEKPKAATEVRFDLDDHCLDNRDPLVRQATSFIENHLFQKFSLADICQHCGCSESSLQRQFQKAYRLSPFSYLKQRRLDESWHLLRSRRYNVSQVSDLLKYENVSAFSTAFRRRFGTSPSQVNQS
ncbi:MAG: helix-turn-helix transcriptional regulator [Pseudobacteriovorax sp.]|nr:helix-turn-helix transcriptional regulator [Pseudobacteriovorax sp.]